MKRHIIKRTVTDGLIVEMYCGKRLWNSELDKYRSCSETCKLCLRKAPAYIRERYQEAK